MTPLSNAFMAPEWVRRMEPCYPLHALVCFDCRPVQLAAIKDAHAIPAEYLYFSSIPECWVRHAASYGAALQLDPQTPVAKVGSNDGYLLQHFARCGIPVLGVDPAGNVAQSTTARDVSTEVVTFGAATARRLRATSPAPALMVTKCALLDFLAGIRRAGQRVVSYGAQAKGNTLLNYCGTGPELLEFTVDGSPHKQGLPMLASRIPIRDPRAII